MNGLRINLVMYDVEISDIVGKAKLKGIDIFAEDRKPNMWADDKDDGYDMESCAVCRIILNRRGYEFWENPEDGYRSTHNGPIIISAGLVKNIFAPVDVVVMHVDKQYTYSEECNIVKIVNIANGETILDVGTRDVDDYYPCWTCNYYPEAIGMVE